jgi:hypothetical protein
MAEAKVKDDEYVKRMQDRFKIVSRGHFVCLSSGIPNLL